MAHIYIYGGIGSWASIAYIYILAAMRWYIFIFHSLPLPVLVPGTRTRAAMQPVIKLKTWSKQNSSRRSLIARASLGLGQKARDIYINQSRWSLLSRWVLMCFCSSCMCEKWSRMTLLLFLFYFFFFFFSHVFVMHACMRFTHALARAAQSIVFWLTARPLLSGRGNGDVNIISDQYLI